MVNSNFNLNEKAYPPRTFVVSGDGFGKITYSDGNDGWLNPELMKIVLEDLLSFPNLDILFETDIENVSYFDKNTVWTELEPGVYGVEVYVEPNELMDFNSVFAFAERVETNDSS